MIDPKEGPMETPEETPHDTTKVLIVDDKPDNIDLIIKILEPEGYNLAFATSGAKAIEVAQHFKPDLILLDVMMPPGMDGFETCAQLKGDPLTADIPVVFVTAKNETTAIIEGFRCGGQDYIPKPFRREEVLSRVRTHVQVRQLIRKQARLIDDLQGALAHVKTLQGLLPICASCKKIRDANGYWHQIESYLRTHADLAFTHGICNECAQRLYPDLDLSGGDK
jgi:CheY-like chemotaxis protein